HLFKGGGKRLRAMLPMLVGQAVGRGHEGHYVLGACIEIIHNFTLVHDDIMDQDPVRRGLRAVHVEFDDSTAINAGDAMLALSFEMMADSAHIDDEQLRPLVKSIGEMVRRVSEGQQEDFEFEERDHVSEEDYMSMIEGKTSAMFEMCARTGAIIAGASDEVVETMSEWGLMLGLCFQIMDDVIDLRSDTATLGKTSGSDISSGKRTIIALHALSSGKAMPAFEAAYGNEDATEEMIAAAVSDLEESGSLEYGWKRALEYHEAAHQALDRIDESDSLQVLRTITDFQMARIQ
ncbi:MAG: phosphoesterase, partial [Euryarchaeota archaeon]|nr:phosphoesterase [Euryarchaeota archaeon]